MRWTATSPISSAATARPSSSITSIRCPRIRAAHRSGSRRPQRLRVADDVVHLGLAEHLVDRDAEGVARPVEHRCADGFARAHDRAQAKIESLLRARARLHHQLERGREQERVADAVFRHQRERALRIEAPAIADDRLAEVQRGEERVHEAAGPCPIGGGPEEIAFLRIAVVRMNEPRQVAEQTALRHQRAFRRSGGAARVDEIAGSPAAVAVGREMRRRLFDAAIRTA
jgi:hypothetical protein